MKLPSLRMPSLPSHAIGPRGGSLPSSAGTTTFTYDKSNHLVAATGPAGNYQYAYDAFGNRVSETVNGVTTNYVNNPLSMSIGTQSLVTSIAQAYDSGGGLLVTYHYGLGLAATANGILEISAWNQANALRQPTSHTENRNGTEYLVTVYPSPADLARADELDRQSDELRRKAAAPLQKLIAAKQGTVDGHLANAELLRWSGKYDDAIAAINAALKIRKVVLIARIFIRFGSSRSHHWSNSNPAINAIGGKTGKIYPGNFDPENEKKMRGTKTQSHRKTFK